MTGAVLSEAEVRTAFDAGRLASMEPKPRLDDFISWVDSMSALQDSSTRAALAAGGAPQAQDFRRCHVGHEFLIFLFRIKENAREIAGIMKRADEKAARRG